MAKRPGAKGGLWGRDVATQPTGGGNWASPIVGKTPKKPKKLVSVGPVWNPCCQVAINPAQKANFVGAAEGQITWKRSDEDLNL